MKTQRKKRLPSRAVPPKANSNGQSAASVLAAMAKIDDDLTIYLIGMLLDRIAELAVARQNCEPDPPGVRMQ